MNNYNKTAYRSWEHQQFLVVLDVLPRILDLLELVVFLELLAVQELQNAVYLDQIDAPLQDYLIFLIFFVEFVNFSELFDEEGAAFDVIVGLAVQNEDLLL